MVSRSGKNSLHGMYFIAGQSSGGMGAYPDEIFGIRSAVGEYANSSFEV